MAPLYADDLEHSQRQQQSSANPQQDLEASGHEFQDQQSEDPGSQTTTTQRFASAGASREFDNYSDDDQQSVSGRGISRRGPEWKPWEDRALVKEIMACEVLLCAKGRTVEKWEEVSAGMMQNSGSTRSGRSCKSRFQKLLTELRAQNLRSLQKKATNEEISSFLDDMEKLNRLAELQSRDPQIRMQARERQRKLDEQERLTRKHAMEEEMETEGPAKKRRKKLDESISDIEKGIREFSQRIEIIEKNEATRHEQLLTEVRNISRGVQDLCQLMRVFIEKRY
ncbi:hypothetical protein BDZ91DRAFT_737724 [Kalaharituber pfeilii]|nr:hypothetical protein BDZ91DRAFT_737724 [Kalaharituber pfeilii]